MLECVLRKDAIEGVVIDQKGIPEISSIACIARKKINGHIPIEPIISRSEIHVIAPIRIETQAPRKEPTDKRLGLEGHRAPHAFRQRAQQR
jgi:hypothetical protein